MNGYNTFVAIVVIWVLIFLFAPPREKGDQPKAMPKQPARTEQPLLKKLDIDIKAPVSSPPPVSSPVADSRPRKVSVAKVKELVKKGFQYRRTNTCVQVPRYMEGGERGILRSNWLLCTTGIPEFVLEWYRDNPTKRDREIQKWYGWNNKYRTLQHKVDDDTYWIITKWVEKGVWTIERWTRKQGYKILYVKPELAPPRETDTWYHLRRPFADLKGYNLLLREIPHLKVTGFPTANAEVIGSGIQIN